MQYLLLIYGAESIWEGVGDAEHQKMYGQYRALRDELQKAGKFLAGSQLQPVSTAATMRVKNGKKDVTDGPFAETKEQLGGYFLIEAKDRDEALAIAARIPSLHLGCVEVRPLMVH